MVLDPRSSHPSARRYVLKLHRECAADADRLRGRLEHIASGRQLEFATAAELVERLLAELRQPPSQDQP